jgi:hypothetical protein
LLPLVAHLLGLMYLLRQLLQHCSLEAVVQGPMAHAFRS